MLEQERMIERARRVCQADERLVAAMMYGSFTAGEGDAFSDIEFVLFFRDDVLPEVDPREWVSRIAPVELYFVNEFGNGTAIFSDLVRGEFHFDKASDMGQIEGRTDGDGFRSLDSTAIVDRTGELARHLERLVGPIPQRDTPERVQMLSERLINWVLFGTNVLARGELARALEILGAVQRHLLWLVRLHEGRMEHWPTPSRAVERDISEAAYARFSRCTAHLDAQALWVAYLEAWEWGKDLMRGLADRHCLEVPEGLIDKLDRRLRAYGGHSPTA